MEVIEQSPFTPETWIVVFRRTSAARWVRWLAAGKYKHVAAYAYLPGMKAWLFYEVHTRPTNVIVLPDGVHLDLMYNFTLDADLVAMKREPNTPMRPWRRIGFYCVPAIRDLIGLNSSALLPTSLYRDCIAAGGKPLGCSAVSEAA